MTSGSVSGHHFRRICSIESSIPHTNRFIHKPATPSFRGIASRKRFETPILKIALRI